MKIKSVVVLQFLLSIVLLFTIIGCRTDSPIENSEPLDMDATDQLIVNDEIEKEEKIKTIFYSLPSPLELTLMFKREGAEYQREKLHDTNQIKTYNTNKKKALNLGVFGADLSYAGLFSKDQDAINYFVATKKLADDLGISKVFEKDFISRLESNAENKDTLLQVISDFFLENDIYLKTQGQHETSTYVLVGGWIEGMYLGSEMANQGNQEGLKEIIALQKNSMYNLIDLLKTLDKDSTADSLVSKMDILAAIYEKVDISENPENNTDDQMSILPRKNNKNYKMSDPVFQAIQQEIGEIRKYITK